MIIPTVGYGIVGCLVSWLVTFYLLKFRIGRANSEKPQHHHTHTKAIPRIGGMGMVVGLLFIHLLFFIQSSYSGGTLLVHFAVMGGALASFALGIIDDFKPLGAKLKLLIQVVIAIAVYQCGLTIDRVTIPFTDTILELEFFGLLFTVLWFVAMMNLINLIDGLDGLAGGIGLMLMVLLAYLGVRQGGQFSSVLAIGMIGVIFGFLLHNFPPAKCYMGDSGAYLIGYMIAALSLLNSQKGAVMAAMIAPVMALALPILDVAYALLRRGLRGLPLFRPDRGHIHHLLIKTGLSRKHAVLVLYGISLISLIGGLIVFVENGRHLPVFFGFAFVVLIFVLRGQNVSTNSFLVFLTDSLQSRKEVRNALYLRDWLVAEAERADSVAHLWSDFQFVLRKIGICRAELTIANETREFYIPNTPTKGSDGLWEGTHEVKQTQNPLLLKLYGEKDNFSESQFTLVADIAAETWCNTCQKWETINECPADFDAIGKEPESYQEQKSRNLYRPTY